MHFQQLDFLITTTDYYQMSYKRIYSKCDFTHDTKYAQPIDSRFHEFHPKSPHKETNQGAQSVGDGLSKSAYNRSHITDEYDWEQVMKIVPNINY
jgi:hypothetical protein